MPRSYGRDFWLSVRMAVALGLVALLYLVPGSLSAGLIASGLREGHVGDVIAGTVLIAVIAALLVAQLRKSEELVLRRARAKMLEPGERPDLQELVARLAAQADLPAPRVAIIHTRAPNALTAARSPSTAVVALTSELLRRLEPHELQAVVAHELAHVANRDGPVMTFVGAPAMLGSHFWNEDKFDYLIRGWLYFPFHVLGLLLLWTISRYREYVADRGAVLITGAPENLMSALLKIEGGAPPRKDLRRLAVRSFCIVGWKSKWRRFELVMDHPPMKKRIARLEELARELGKPVG